MTMMLMCGLPKMRKPIGAGLEVGRWLVIEQDYAELVLLSNPYGHSTPARLLPFKVAGRRRVRFLSCADTRQTNAQNTSGKYRPNLLKIFVTTRDVLPIGSPTKITEFF